MLPYKYLSGLLTDTIMMGAFKRIYYAEPFKASLIACWASLLSFATAATACCSSLPMLLGVSPVASPPIGRLFFKDPVINELISRSVALLST